MGRGMGRHNEGMTNRRTAHLEKQPTVKMAGCSTTQPLVRWGMLPARSKQARNIARTSPPSKQLPNHTPVADFEAVCPPVKRRRPLPNLSLSCVRLSSANMANQTPAVVMDKYVDSGELRPPRTNPPAYASASTLICLSGVLANHGLSSAARVSPS